MPGELIGHADAGSQYTSIRFTEHLDLEGVRPSIGSVGDTCDCEDPAAGDEALLAGSPTSLPRAA